MIGTSGSREKPYQVLIKKTGASGLAGAAATREMSRSRGLSARVARLRQRARRARPVPARRRLRRRLALRLRRILRTRRTGQELVLASPRSRTSCSCRRPMPAPEGPNHRRLCVFSRARRRAIRGSPLPDSQPADPAGFGPTRVAVGYDRLIFKRVMLGARAGWAGVRRAALGEECRRVLAAACRAPPELLARPRSARARGPSRIRDDHGRRRTVRHRRAGTGQRGSAAGEPARRKRSPPNARRKPARGRFFLGVGAGALVRPSRRTGVNAALRVLEVFPFGATVVSARARLRDRI